MIFWLLLYFFKFVYLKKLLKIILLIPKAIGQDLNSHHFSTFIVNLAFDS